MRGSKSKSASNGGESFPQQSAGLRLWKSLKSKFPPEETIRRQARAGLLEIVNDSTSKLGQVSGLPTRSVLVAINPNREFVRKRGRNEDEASGYGSPKASVFAAQQAVAKSSKKAAAASKQHHKNQLDF